MLSSHFSIAANSLSADNPWVLLVDVGTALWLGAYVLAIRQGFVAKTYSIPLVAICSNFAWEILASFAWTAPIRLWHVGAVLWMGFDAVIVFQLFRYGRAQQTIPEIQRYYLPVLLGTFALAFAGQYTFTRFYPDPLGFEDAYLINTTMSVLFVFMYFVRRQRDNYTYGIAWLKMFGTGLTSLGLITLLPELYPGRPNFAFMHFLYATIFALDALYVLLLTRERFVNA
jgi:hypothetical protein